MERVFGSRGRGARVFRVVDWPFSDGGGDETPWIMATLKILTYFCLKTGLRVDFPTPSGKHSTREYGTPQRGRSEKVSGNTIRHERNSLQSSAEKGLWGASLGVSRLVGMNYSIEGRILGF